MIKLLLVSLVALAGLHAAEGGGFELPTDTPPVEAKDVKEAKEKAQPAAPVVATPPIIKQSNRRVTESIAGFAAAHNLKLTKYGTGAVRIWIIGDGAVPQPESLIATGEQALKGLDTWTGKQGLFNPHDEEENLHVVIFANDQDYNGWLDASRSQGIIGTMEGEDLAKKLGGTPFPRGQTKTLGRVAPGLRHYMVYAVCTAALDAFYAERGGKAHEHAWIREGLAAEMQRLLCDGQVRCYTISYEDATIKLQEDWAKTMSTMLTTATKNDKTIRRASEIMRFSLINMPSANYVQLWSFCTYARTLAKNKVGPDNAFAKVLQATATGTASDTAVKAAFGSEDPNLSRAWMVWAANYRSDPKGLNR